MNSPAISIVTISFNQVDFLERCLDSVRFQGDTIDYEHLVVDPGSTDGSREILASRDDPRLRLLLDPDNGPTDGLNNGFERARGSIVMYLNSDDELAPGALEAVSLAMNESKCDVLIGNGWTIDETDTPIFHVVSDRLSAKRAALNIGTVLQQATAYKRDAIGPRPFDESLKYTWDLDLLLRLRADGLEFAYVNSEVGYFRLYDGTITGTPELARSIRQERRMVIERYAGKRTTAVLSSLELPARAIKRMRTRKRNAPPFGGTVGRSKN